MNKKWVFFQAFLLTLVFFIVGLYSGILLEEGRFEEVNEYYIQSEVSLVDIMALDNLVDSNLVSCEDLFQANKDLLDRVYSEARALELYEESGKVTDNLKTFHRKYDVLRTYLWINSLKIEESCNLNFSRIVYLYKSEEEDLTKKAEQNVWSKLLFEVKREKENLLLIPIALDSELISLDSMLEQYNITDSPVVIVNEERIFYEIPNKQEILNLLN